MRGRAACGDLGDEVLRIAALLCVLLLLLGGFISASTAQRLDVSTPTALPSIFAYDGSQFSYDLADTDDGTRANVDSVRIYGYDDHANLAHGPTGAFPSILAAKGSGRALQPYFPPNRGFAGETSTVYLRPGTTIDRYGGRGGSRFFAPAGTPKGARSLPPATADQPLRSFEVLKPIPVEAGTTAPWFGQLGGGIQYRTPVTLETLLRRGIIGELGP